VLGAQELPRTSTVGATHFAQYTAADYALGVFLDANNRSFVATVAEGFASQLLTDADPRKARQLVCTSWTLTQVTQTRAHVLAMFLPDSAATINICSRGFVKETAQVRFIAVAVCLVFAGLLYNTQVTGTNNVGDKLRVVAHPPQVGRARQC